MGGQRTAMLKGAVALVPVKTIRRITLVILQHESISSYLCNDARSCDTPGSSVTFDQCPLLFAPSLKGSIAVDEKYINGMS